MMTDRRIASVEVRRDVHDRYNQRVDEEHARMIWAHKGMTTWYRNKKGRVVSLSPWRLVDYWKMTRRPTSPTSTWYRAISRMTDRGSQPPTALAETGPGCRGRELPRPRRSAAEAGRGHPIGGTIATTRPFTVTTCLSASGI